MGVEVEGWLFDQEGEVAAQKARNVGEVMLHRDHIPQAQQLMPWIFHLRKECRSDMGHTHRLPGRLNHHTGPLVVESAEAELWGYLTIDGEVVVVELEEVVEQPGGLM